jgi:aminopeptidase I
MMLMPVRSRVETTRWGVPLVSEAAPQLAYQDDVTPTIHHHYHHPTLQTSHPHPDAASMTKNQPGLRKTVSTADLYSNPSPPLRSAGLSRTLTAINRPRPRPHHSITARTGLQQSVRHSIAAPSSNLIDFDDDFGAVKEEEHQTPPPVPPKVKMEPGAVPEIPAFGTRKSERRQAATKEGPEMYTKPFTDFMTNNPTVFHAVDTVAMDLEGNGYQKLSERDTWDLKRGGKYYVDRNGSSLIAFSIGEGYEAGNGAAVIAGHIDALTAKLKPIPKLRTKAGFVQLGVAPYAGALGDTWWDRDLGIGGRVLVKEDHKVVSKLVKLNWPIARIPTLAPHFGAVANGPFNKETQMVPIIGLDNSDLSGLSQPEDGNPRPMLLGGEGAFTATQPERLVRAISRELNITDCKLCHRQSSKYQG